MSTLTSAEQTSDEQFERMKKKAYENIVDNRKEEINQIKRGYGKIEDKFEEIEQLIMRLTAVRQKKRKNEKMSLVIIGALILFVLFVAQMFFLKERNWRIFS